MDNTLQNYKIELLNEKYLKSLIKVFIITIPLPVIYFFYCIIIYNIGNVSKVTDNYIKATNFTSYTGVGFSALFYFLSYIIYITRFRKLNEYLKSNDISITQVKNTIRSILVVPAILISSSGLLGLLAIHFAMNGVLQLYPIYWLNLYGFVIFILHVIFKYPTKKRVKLFLEKLM